MIKSLKGLFIINKEIKEGMIKLAYYIVDKSETNCSQGSKSQSLNVGESGKNLDGSNFASVSNNDLSSQDGNFGVCNILSEIARKAAQNPSIDIDCTPAALGLPWLNTAERVKLDGNPVLTDKSITFCPIGGYISIESSQSKVGDRATLMTMPISDYLRIYNIFVAKISDTTLPIHHQLTQQLRSVGLLDKNEETALDIIKYPRNLAAVMADKLYLFENETDFKAENFDPKIQETLNRLMSEINALGKSQIRYETTIQIKEKQDQYFKLFNEGTVKSIIDASKKMEEKVRKEIKDMRELGYSSETIFDTLEQGSVGTNGNFNYDWKKQVLRSPSLVTDAFLAKVADISRKLGINPDDLMAVIAFETESTFDPSFKTGNATGLIQFMPLAADEMGTTIDALANMSAIEQLDYVYKYYSDRAYLGELRSLGDIYMVTLFPKAVGKEDTYVLYSQGSKYYEPNKYLDINRDGNVEKHEALQRIINTRKAFEK